MSLDLVFQYLLSPTFFHGAAMTLLITVSSLVFGLLAGFVLASLGTEAHLVDR